MFPTSAGDGANGKSKQCFDTFCLVETLMRGISRCEILNNGVIIKIAVLL